MINLVIDFWTIDNNLTSSLRVIRLADKNFLFGTSNFENKLYLPLIQSGLLKLVLHRFPFLPGSIVLLDVATHLHSRWATTVCWALEMGTSQCSSQLPCIRIPFP